MKKLIILFAVFSILISAVSCKKQENLLSGRETVLRIEDSECAYSDTAKAKFSEQILEFIKKTSQRSGFEISKEDLESITAYINDSFFDKLQAIPIYENELSEVISASSKSFESESENSLLEIYTSLSTRLGNDRCCKLIFEGATLWLSNIESDKNAELLRILTQELGEDTFSEILGVFMFCASISSGVLLPQAENASIVNDAELLMVLKRQANYYLSLEIPPEQWSLAVKIFSETDLLNKSEKNIFSIIMCSLSSSGFFSDAAAATPEFLSLYAAAINSLSVADIAKLRSDSANKLQVVCHALSQAESEFTALTEVLSKNASADINEGYDAIKDFGYEQQYLDFIDNMEYSKTPTLFEAIKAYASTPSISAYGDLNRAMLAFAFKLSPSLSFAIEHRLAEGF